MNIDDELVEPEIDKRSVLLLHSASARVLHYVCTTLSEAVS